MNLPPPPKGPPFLQTQSEALDSLIHAALQWRSETGWPGREHDLQLAARLYAKHRGPTMPEEIYAAWHLELATALLEGLAETHPPDEVPHRHLLCLLVIQGVSRELTFSA